MPVRSVNPGPVFHVGDHVTITFPGKYRGKQGEVIEVPDHKGDHVYRCHVRFPDGQTATFFEFEIMLIAA